MIPDHVAKFIAALSRQFSPPRLDEFESERWMQDYVRALGSWNPETLAKAAQIIFDSRTDRRFPLPAECIAACRKADEEIAKHKRENNLLSHGERDQSPWASWRQDTADMLIKTEMGKRAVKDGCILTLWNYCRENGRLPSEEVYAQMIRGADKTLELIERIANETDGVAQACARFGQTVLERRKQMAEFVDGKGEAIWRT